MSERSEGTSPFQFSPRPSVSHSSPSVSHRHSHNPLRLSFTLDDTFRELDEFQEDPPLFLEENSWEGEESELSDPTLTLLNQDHYQVGGVPVRNHVENITWMLLSEHHYICIVLPGGLPAFI